MLTVAGFTWEESTRALEITDEGRAKLRDLSAIQSALEILQPRTLDLTSCPLLENVDALRVLRTPVSINLCECPILKTVDGIPAASTLKKVYLFQSPHISTESLDAIEKRLPKIYLVLPDGTGLNPPREER